MRFIARLVPFALALSLAAPAAAQSDADKATARQLGVEGQEALDKKDFKTAEDRYKRADQLFRAPTLALGLARAYAGVGKLVAAQETYNRIIRDGVPAGSPPAFVKALEDARTEVQAVSARLGSVVITVTGGENAKVTLDEQPFPNAALGVKRPVDPGEHVVRATADGMKPAETKVVIAPGGAATANLVLEKDPRAVAAAPVVAPVPATTAPAATSPAAPPAVDRGTEPPAVSTEGGSMNKPLGYVALGVGGVGLVVGGITGIMAIGKHSDLEKACPGGKCTDAQKDDVNRYKTLGLLSTVGFAVGIVGAGAGAVLLLTAGPDAKPAAAALPTPLVRTARNAPAPARVTPFVGLGSVGASGQF